ncbi:MAG TPA: PIN domain-containing protein [Thermodesulfobacteriota bacterium]|jgi:predicted nucleic acid-binding protein|nr:PIN domain-containing protein [Thermodesulfobacteriota bacterium]
MIGIDTGFFVELIKGNKQTLNVWNEILDGDDSVVSCISLYELKKLALKGSIDRHSIDTLLEAIKNICTIAWLDNYDVFMAAANLSHGLGLHMSDSFILSGFIRYGATTIYTVDPHFCSYKKKGVNVILMDTKS